ncbi:MAG TPA: putative bacteriocin export ABC transporter [Clostridiales bacterium]|nr:putative bacteriocin export ABC transporter [Clostridiales bacterium]
MSIISLTDICKKFNDKVIFDNFNLEIKEGEFVAIAGKSGAGKTTLLNIIGLLEKPDSGDVQVCNVKNATFDSHKGMLLLRKDISYLFQNYGLIESESVMYNLKLATRFSGLGKKEAEEKCTVVMKKVGLDGFEKKKVYQLSGGEQQRVAMAKIILKESKVILADEPTGSLDKENEELILGLLKDLNDSGRTIVVVTHSEKVMGFAGRCVVIS